MVPKQAVWLTVRNRFFLQNRPASNGEVHHVLKQNLLFDSEIFPKLVIGFSRKEILYVKKKNIGNFGSEFHEMVLELL